jgi:hypothetical protein
MPFLPPMIDELGYTGIPATLDAAIPSRLSIQTFNALLPAVYRFSSSGLVLECHSDAPEGSPVRALPETRETPSNCFLRVDEKRNLTLILIRLSSGSLTQYYSKDCLAWPSV